MTRVPLSLPQALPYCAKLFRVVLLFMDQRTTVGISSNTIGLSQMIAAAWKAKWVVIGVVTLCTVAGGVIGKQTVKQYRAEILVSPAQESPTGGGSLSGLSSQVGGLAALAGLSGGGKGSTFRDETIAVLQSQLITEAYIRDNDLLPVLFAKSWDPEAKRWKSADPKKIPTLWLGAQAFKKIRDVKQDKASGLVTLRITWKDPVVAAHWANDFVRITNAYLRDRAIRESDQNIQYLNLEAAKTSMVEAKTAIFSILKDEVNKQMIAKGRDEYALKVIDPAETPERPSTPAPLLIAILGFAVGTILSALYVLQKTGIFGTPGLREVDHAA